MGDVREFLLALVIYVGSAIALFAILNATVGTHFPPALRAVAVLGGGFILGACVILLWGVVLRVGKSRE